MTSIISPRCRIRFIRRWTTSAM